MSWKWLVIPVLAAAAAGQQATVTIHPRHAESAGELREMATVIRSTGDMREVAADVAAMTLTCAGTPAQVALAEWVSAQLDGEKRETARYEYPADDSEGTVRVYYLASPATADDFQEIVTLFRTLTEIPRIFTYHPTRAVVVRGTATQVALADWVVRELDQPAGKHAASAARMAAENPQDVVRIFRFGNAPTATVFQQEALIMRSLAEIRTAFGCNPSRAVGMRATPQDLAVAEWLFEELDGRVQAGPREYVVPGGGEDVVGLFRVKAGSAAELQRMAVEVRSGSGVRRLFTSSDPEVLAMRGTAEQVAEARKMIGERAR